METSTANRPCWSRRLERMAAEDERRGRGSADDRAFFKRTGRKYRARLATPYEVAAFEMMSSNPAPPSDEMFLWSMVRQIKPGIRQRFQMLSARHPSMPHGRRLATILARGRPGTRS